MRSVIITGATSFIGINLINELIKGDYNVIAIVRRNSNNLYKLPKSAKIKIVQLNMEEINSLTDLIKDKQDIFIHLAWNGTRGKDRDDKGLQESNYQYSMDAIEVAHELDCKIFIGAGSQAEYGLYNCEISELTECMPVTEYGKSKLKTSNDGYNFCKKYHMNFKWPRFFSLYGIEDYEGTLIISTIDKMLKNEGINLTECIQMWNFLYIKDAVRGIIKLMEAECQDGVYNFGSNDTRQLKSYIEEIYDIIKTKSEIMYGTVPYPKTGMVSVQPNIDKLKSETGWEPITSFRTGIEEVILSRRKKLGVK